MAAAKDRSISQTDWRANDVKQLRKIWNDLHPELDDKDADRMFRDRRLTPDEAGDIFELRTLDSRGVPAERADRALCVPSSPPGISERLHRGRHAPAVVPAGDDSLKLSGGERPATPDLRAPQLTQ
jgi:hypothetical protein